MSTPPPVSTIRPSVCIYHSSVDLHFFLQNPLLLDNDEQAGDQVFSRSQINEEGVTLVQTPGQEQSTDAAKSTANAANPTFAVLKATGLQTALGHPLAYARVLMQVR